MIGSKQVSAVIPTRGDVPLEAIRERLLSVPEIDDAHFVVGPNVFGRYTAPVRHEIVYTQDDDCLTDVAAVLAAYEPGVIVNAMTPEHAAQYPGWVTLIGFGAVFDRSMAEALDVWERDDLFLRECDRVFTALYPHKTVFPGITMLHWATEENRLYRQPDHLAARAAIMRRIYERTGRR
jgi:hypothetical protein